MYKINSIIRKLFLIQTTRTAMEEKISTYKLNLIILDDKKSKSEMDDSILKKVKSLVDHQKFAVYSITPEIIESTSSWMSGCRALIIYNKNILENHELNNVNTYENCGGQVVKMYNNSKADIEKELEVNGLLYSGGLLNLKENDSEQNVGYYYLRSEDDYTPLSAILPRLKNNVLLQGKVGLVFSEALNDDAALDNEEVYYLSAFNESSKFNLRSYLDNLKTDYIGKNILYIPSVSTSMDIVSGAPLIDGLVVIVEQQTQGKGRGGNRWISPQGCAMFTLQLHLKLGKGIGKTPSIVQHLVSLAVVQALGGDIEVRLKWPNDIYYKNEVKLGGVIATSSILSDSLIINIGCGLNLDNSTPTISFNKLRNDAGLEPLSRELYLAQVFNKLERIMKKFAEDKQEKIFEEYYEAWLHSNQEILVQDNSSKQSSRKAKILAIDEFGYLIAQDLESGDEFKVHDNGNSFDMMQGLIRPKFS